MTEMPHSDAAHATRPFELDLTRTDESPVSDEDRAKLYCLEVREPESQPTQTALVLHGGPGASMDYLRPQMDGLAGPDRRLIYYDQRGGGRSLLPPSWPAAGIAEHLADLRRVIAACGTRPALVGYSWGGLLALHYALEEPTTISRLLLVSPAPPNESARDEMRRRLRAGLERPDVRAFIATLDLGGALSPDTRRQRFAARVAGYFHDPSRALELTPFMVRERAERSVWTSLAGYDLRPRLAGLAVDTLVLHGVEDPVPIEGAREIAHLSGAALIELPRCGHAPYIEAATAFFPAARRFLDGKA